MANFPSANRSSDGGDGTPDNTTETFIPKKSGGEFVDSAMSEDASNVTSNKPIVAPSVTVDVGTLHLGNAISMSVGGENIYYKDGVDGSIHGSVFQDVGDILPRARVLGAFNPMVVRQPTKTDVVNDPKFSITPTGNEQILAFTIEAWYPQDDVVLRAYKSGVEFYKHEIGSIPGGVEHQIDLLIGDGVPVDVYGGTEYEIEMTSESGTVSLKGLVDVPFYAVTYYDFEFQDLVTANLPINEETLISGFSTATSQEPVGLDTPLRIEFGAAQGAGSDPLEIDATGLIKCNVSGTYFIQVYVQYGRSTSAGACDLFFAAFVNGTQIGNSSHARLDDGDTLIPSRARSNIELTAGDELEFLLTRDSIGINNGGLFDGNPNTPGWADSTCASIVMSRLVGNAATLQSDGDVAGPGSSQQDEIPTYANLTGKEIKASSGVSAISRVIKSISPDSELILTQNGNADLVLGDESGSGVNIRLKQNGSSVLNNGGGSAVYTVKGDGQTGFEIQDSLGNQFAQFIELGGELVAREVGGEEIVWKVGGIEVSGLLISSNGEVSSLDGTAPTLIGSISNSVEINAPTNNDVQITADDDTRAGFDIRTNGLLRGGLGYRSTQLVLQPSQYGINDDSRGVIIDTTDTQTRVEGVKHYIDNGFDGGSHVIEPPPGRNLYLKPTGGEKAWLGKGMYARDDGSINVISDSSLPTTTPTMQFNGPSSVQMPILNQAQMDAAVTNSPADSGKMAFNISTGKLQCHDGSQWNDCF